MKSLTFHN